MATITATTPVPRGVLRRMLSRTEDAQHSLRDGYHDDIATTLEEMRALLAAMLDEGSSYILSRMRELELGLEDRPRTHEEIARTFGVSTEHVDNLLDIAAARIG